MSNAKCQIENKLTELIDKLSSTITPREIVELAKREKAVGIAYTYNEPAIFAEFAADTMKLARKAGLKNVFVSNGFASVETFAYLKEYLDAINIDLKSFRGEFYRKICKAKIEPVLENIPRYFQAGIETEVTTLLIPGHNDSREELGEIARFLGKISPELPWHISAFYPAYKLLDAPPTPVGKLIEAYEIGKAAGLKYIYVGNVWDPQHSSTFCPKCRTLLISRAGYEVKIENLDQQSGRCRKCREKIYGIWS